MQNGKAVIWSVIALITIFMVILFSVTIGSYNNLVNLDEGIKSDLSQVKNRLQQRHDTIEQMVAVINGLQEHEQTIYQMIVDARAAYLSASNSGNIDDLAEADALEAQTITQLLVVVESNPQITVSSAYNTLLLNIEINESQLSQARKDYNDTVEEYNATVRRFPGVLFRSLFSFNTAYEYWKIDDGATEVPNIVFD